jgi:hypothetical protein
MDVPDSNPRASAEISVRNPERLTLTDGTFFLPGCYAVPCGRASALRTMCGSRTGEWSLPCLMSD